MPNPALVATFFRELWVARTLPREPEPDLVMEDSDQVAAYAEAGRIDGVMSASYLFHSARISQTLQGCKTVYDLGCGPGTQLGQIAELNPNINFIGVDLSSTMLSDAEKQIQALGLKNVSFRQGDITTLDVLPDASGDGLISTMALHHLPTFVHLENCFSAIKRVLKPEGALYLTDFGRLKSLNSVIYFAYMNAKHQPHLFSLDYERSLRAAFLLEEFEQLTEKYFSSRTRVFSTFKVPFLLTIKTGDHPLPQQLRSRIRQMRRDLPRKYRGDLDDMRIFFRLGGLKNDPFSSSG
jgi:arsenite methyltransferase